MLEAIYGEEDSFDVRFCNLCVSAGAMTPMFYIQLIPITSSDSRVTTLRRGFATHAGFYGDGVSVSTIRGLSKLMRQCRNRLRQLFAVAV